MAKEGSPTSQEEFVRLDWRLTGYGEITCQVSPGCFYPPEVLVTVKIDDELFQYFADEDYVETEKPVGETEEVCGWVRVRVRQEKEDGLEVVLSGEPAKNHGNVLNIPKNLIRGIKVPKNLIHPA